MGVIADVGGTSRLSRLLGPSRAMEILMTGRDYSAQQALDWGLINYYYSAENLIAEAEKMAQDIALTAPLAVGAVKKIIKRGDGVDLMTQQDMEANHNSILLRTEDFQEGITRDDGKAAGEVEEEINNFSCDLKNRFLWKT